MQLGDELKKALTAIGVTEERVARWLGPHCGCKERQEKLNRLGAWAWRVLNRSSDKDRQYFEEIVK